MKCNNCGTENHESHGYCNNCGQLLKGRPVCGSCGAKLPKKSNFCVACGLKVQRPAYGRKGKAHKITRSGGARSRRSSARNNKRGRIVLIASVAVAAIVLAGYFLYVPRGGAGFKQASGSEQQVLWSDEVQQIASKFFCPCGQCGEELLSECDCEIRGGATEARRYILRLLDENLPEEEIMRRFEEKYGNKV